MDILEDPQEMSTSLAEIGASTCDDLQRVQKMQHRPSTMQDQVRKTCLRQEEWQASAKPDKDDPFDEPTCQEKMTDPNFNTPTNVATSVWRSKLVSPSTCSLCTIQPIQMALSSRSPSYAFQRSPSNATSKRGGK